MSGSGTKIFKNHVEGGAHLGAIYSVGRSCHRLHYLLAANQGYASAGAAL